MYKTLFPSRDTTLYSRHVNRNTGADQILELSKVASGSAVMDILSSHERYDTNLNTRILIDFDLTAVSQSIVSGDITNPTFYLTLKATEATELPLQYTIMAYPVSASWTNGTGFYNNDPEITNGASWKYRTGKGIGLEWATPGATYYTSSAASQSFNYTYPDVRMNVTTIVNEWLSGSIDQHGFILKFTDEKENDGSIMGQLKFFSKDTHTVYIPRLEVFWDDVDVSGTGSISTVGEDYIVYTKNLRNNYYENETPKIRFNVRDRFPSLTYATSSNYLSSQRLPYDSFFQIMDSKTDEVIVPFDTTGTRVSCDTTGNYIRLDMDSLLPERMYKVVLKVLTDSGDTINYVDDDFFFKVRRR